MTAKELLDIVRGSQRPWLVFIFPTAVVAIGVAAVCVLLPVAVKFIDRDIALVIVVSVLSIVAAMVTATTTIMAFLFGERASKKKEEK